MSEPIEQTLRSAKQWLNDGECCGQKGADGVCAAPSCIFGEALKWFHRAADEIERQQDLRRSAISERDATIAENCELRKLLAKFHAHLLAIELYDATDAMRIEASVIISLIEKWR